MSSGSIIALVIVGLIAAILLGWLILTYNTLVALRNHLRESLSDIDVELKRRYELIPNLVATAKAYAQHEQELFAQVIALRAQATASYEESASERQLRGGVQRILALAEAYPELKADAHFRELQQELVITEDRLAAARRFYNGNVRDYRNAREQFPSSLVANLGGFEQVDWLLAEPQQRHPPQVTR